MRKSAGFTLIELVIVIVILGILGAVAAPKFLNLQGDAYGANLQAVKSSMESAATLVNTKAILAGKDRGDDDGKASVAIDGVTGNINLVYGYPDATGIIDVLDIDAKEYDSSTIDDDIEEYVYTAAEDSSKVDVWPRARYGEAECKVTYTNADKGERPAIAVAKDNC